MLTRRNTDKHPTDWLTQLPPSTLVELMQQRCRLLGGIVKSSPANKTFHLLTDEEVVHHESRIQL